MPTKLFIPVMLAAIAVAGCGSTSSGSSTSGDTSTTATTSTTAERHPVLVEIDAPEDQATVHGHVVEVRGSVQPASARVRVDGLTARVTGDGTFHRRVRLNEIGENTVQVDGSAPGYSDSESASITVIRKRTAAEQAALRAKRARERELRRQRKLEAEAAFKASAQSIEYSQLIKDPDRFAGKRVKYTGPIFQAREEAGSNFLLMNTTCDEFDICDDLIYVTYDFHINSAEKDTITVYGVVKGGYEYDTTGGGTNFVPEIHAKYIEE